MNTIWTQWVHESLVHRSENIHLQHPTKHTDTHWEQLDSCKSTELYKHTWLFNLSAYGFLTVRLFSVKNSSSLIQHEKWTIYFLSITFPHVPQTALHFHLCMEFGTQGCYYSHKEWVCSLHQADEEIRWLGFSRERYVVGTATRSVFYSCYVQPES